LHGAFQYKKNISIAIRVNNIASMSQKKWRRCENMLVILKSLKLEKEKFAFTLLKDE